MWAKAVGASVLVLSGGAIRAQPPVFVDNELEWAAWRVVQPGKEYCGEGVGLMVAVVGDQLGWWQAAGTVDNHMCGCLLPLGKWGTSLYQVPCP